MAIFFMVYIGMVLGGLPRLKLDRSGVALLGAIAVIGLGAMSTEQAASAVDLPTVLLLFSFMVVSAQMRLDGFYTAVTRRVAALVGAGVLLLSRRLHSSQVMGFVDWPLLVLFMGLFVVNHAFESTGLATLAVAMLGVFGVQFADPGALFVAGVGLSNLVSNVPAVMLLLPHLKGVEAGVTLAMVSTLAGNLLLVSSIASHSADAGGGVGLARLAVTPRHTDPQAGVCSKRQPWKIQ